MKVLQINSVCGIGSTGRIATDLHQTLIDNGHSSYIAYGKRLPKNCNDTIKIGTNFDVYTHGILTRLFDKHGFGSKNATKEFIERIKIIDPDIIHLHNIHGYYINIEILFNYLSKANKPVIWTLHDCWAFTGHCVHFDYVGCNKWQTGCYDCPEKKKYPASFLLDNSKLNYKIKKDLFTSVDNLTLITPSKWLAGLVKKSFLSKYPCHIINNGIDLNIFKPTKSDFRKKHNLENKFIILGVANVWNERKGFKYFLKMAKKIKEDEVIVLVGLSKNQLQNLPSNIIGITRTSNAKELAAIYTAANVFVNPTLEEVLGLTNIESLACGTPVITFDTGGSVECIDSNSGTIVEKGNITGLHKEISRIKTRNKIFCENKIISQAHLKFNKNDRFSDYIFYYKELILS